MDANTRGKSIGVRSASDTSEMNLHLKACFLGRSSGLAKSEAIPSIPAEVKSRHSMAVLLWAMEHIELFC